MKNDLDHTRNINCISIINMVNQTDFQLGESGKRMYFVMHAPFS